MRPALIAALAGLLGGPAHAWDTSRNPDGWTSAQLTEMATESENAYQTLISNGVADRRNQSSTLVTVLGDVNMPLTNSFSLRVGAGTDLTNTHTNDASTLNVSATDSDNNALVFVLAPRFFFLDHPLTWQPADRNPDRWPSLGLALRGSKSLSRAKGQSQGVVDQGLSAWNSNVTVDLRIPTSDHWTVIPSLSGVYSYASLPETPGANGSKTVNRTLNGGVDTRYYFVGSNLIPKDSGQNPDRWTMVDVSVSGGRMLAGSQDIIFNGGTADTFRNQRSFNAGLQAGTRLPVTNHLTLLFSAQGAYTQTTLDEIKAIKGTTNHIPSFNYSTIIRYYFF